LYIFNIRQYTGIFLLNTGFPLIIWWFLWFLWPISRSFATLS